jgi:Zn-dependent protease with chaperone function
MVFAVRCLGVSLGIFILVYAGLSLLVVSGRKFVLGACRSLSPAASADVLFAWRILPLLAALSLTLGYVIPSFVLLEPHHTDEPYSFGLVMLGVSCTAVFAAGLWRALRAQHKATQATAQWLSGAEVMPAVSPVPVFRTRTRSPALTVAGVYAPRVLVSESTLSVLTEQELQTALRHEIAHVRRQDNLKKLLFRFSVFPGMTPLESAWSDAAEMAADDAAVSSIREALDLAAALIKLSRLAQARSPIALTTGFLQSSSGSLAARIERLFAWDHALGQQGSQPWFYAVPAVAIVSLCAVSTYGSVLSGMHILTEWLVR